MKSKLALIFALLIAFSLLGPAPAKALAPVTGCDDAGTALPEVIASEIDYDQDLTDDEEFIELYFPYGGTFTGCEVRLLNGNGGVGVQYNDALDLSAQGAIAPGTYFVWGSTGVVVRDATIQNGAVDCATNCIQNGAPDGFAIVDTSSGSDVLFDLVSYEGTYTYLTQTSTDIVCSETDDDAFSCARGSDGNWTSLSPATPGVVGPTAIELSNVTASSSTRTSAVVLLGAAVLLSGGLLAIRRRRA